MENSYVASDVYCWPSHPNKKINLIILKKKKNINSYMEHTDLEHEHKH